VARGFIAAAFVACTLGSPLGGQTPVPTPPADTTQRRQVGALRPGDVLKIVVFRDRS